MSKKDNDRKWIVYPEIPLTIDDYKKHINMQEKNELLPEVENVVETTLVEEISTINEEIIDTEIIPEEVELTDEEKKKQFIEALKNSRKKFRPIKTVGNKTTNQFGAAYKKKRAAKNKLAKKSRKINRK